MFKILYLGLYLLLFGNCIGDYPDRDTKWQMLCPGLYPRAFTSYTPRGNLSSGIYTTQPLNTMKHCVAACCTETTCNVALMHNGTCYHVQCKSSKLCIPLYRKDLANENPPSMVLVKPVEEDEMWSDLLDQINDDTG